MKVRDARIFWNPSSSDVAVLPVDSGEDPRHLRYSGGACYQAWVDARQDLLLLWMVREALVLIVRDQVDPAAVHRAFMAIDEYRYVMPHDMPTP